MAITDTTFYRTRSEILAEMLADLVAAIPDAYVGEDGVTRIVLEIDAGQLENLSLAHQLLLQDGWIQTASGAALQRYGDQYEVPMKIGTQSVGSLQFEGSGGTYIGIGAEVAYDPGSGLDPIYFETTTDGTIPDPGTPAAPTVAVNAVAGNLNGAYEYVVTFVTASGETLASTDSAVVNPVNQQVDLSNIPIGGPGTTARRIYRMKNGTAPYRRVVEIANNAATAYTDNITDAVVNVATQVPSVDTAHRVVVTGQSQDVGVEANVAIGTITELSNAPATLTGVTNTTAFAGASDPEETEEYRERLLEYARTPGSGSPNDLKAWAEAMDGVGSATVFSNTPLPGHTTVRISGLDGSIPSGSLIADVQAMYDARNLANITVHTDSFTAVATNVTVDVTTSGTYAIGDVTASVVAAIQDYINGLDVGATLRISGIVDAVFGLPGIDDVTVTTPATNQVTNPTDKRTPGVINVT